MKPGRKHIQFTLRVTLDLEEAAPVARFMVKRAQLPILQRRGFGIIENHCRAFGTSPSAGAAAVMFSVRTTLLAMIGAGETEIDDSPLAPLAVWYMMFRIDNKLLDVKLKRVEGVHMYFLDGQTDHDPPWPDIKIATSVY